MGMNTHDNWFFSDIACDDGASAMPHAGRQIVIDGASCYLQHFAPEIDLLKVGIEYVDTLEELLAGVSSDLCLLLKVNHILILYANQWKLSEAQRTLQKEKRDVFLYWVLGVGLSVFQQFIVYEMCRGASVDGIGRGNFTLIDSCYEGE